MDGLRKGLAILALVMLMIAFSLPALAQTSGGRMAQPSGAYQRGGQQAGQGQQGGAQQSNVNLMATMANQSDIGMFTAAVKAAGYDKMLSQSQGPIMVLAPTDAALRRDMGIRNASALTSDPAAAKSLVEDCIVPKLKEPAQGATTVTLSSISGKQIIAKKSNAGITVNGIKVVNATIATNGILAVTDGVVAK